MNGRNGCRAWALSVAAFAGAMPMPAFAAAEPADVPVEADSTDPALTKIVLIAGGPAKMKVGDHEWFAGSAVLFRLLKQTPGVFPVLVKDGWPKNPKVLEGAKAVVFYMDGGGKQPFLSAERMDVLAKLMDAGCGLANLHQVIDYPRTAGAQVAPWLGGYWDKEIGCRGHWVGECKDFPDHPAFRGVSSFSVDDGWIFNIKFLPDAKNLTPLLKVVPPEKLRTTADAKKHPGRAEVMAWTYERENGGRAFTFVGGHLHSSWGKPDFRRFVVNGLLWAAKVEVPAGGAKVELTEAELNHDLPKAAPAKTKE